MRPPLPAVTVTAAVAAELPQDSSDPSPLDKELDRIRQRRTGQTGFFRGTFDDWTLVFGVIAGAIFFGGMMVMSTHIKLLIYRGCLISWPTLIKPYFS